MTLYLDSESKRRADVARLDLRIDRLKLDINDVEAKPGPKGDTGAPGSDGAAGPANVLTIGTVTDGTSAAATITGTSPAQVLNLTLPKGDKGDDGADGSDGADGTNATITSATASGLAAGEDPTVTLGGTSSARTFAFGIPAGAKGDKGDDGEKGDTGDTGPAPVLTATSSSSVTVGTGTKSFTVASGLAFATGQYVTAADPSSPAETFMVGTVQSYSGTSLSVTVHDFAGTGTLSSWRITLSGTRGAAGAGLTILGSKASEASLPASGESGDAWITEDDGHLWVWSVSDDDWLDVGLVRGPAGLNWTGDYVNGTSYSPPDAVFYDGSAWVANQNTSGGTGEAPGGVGGSWDLLAQGGADGTDLPDATTSTKGKVELATSAETITGSDTARVTTPAGVKAALDTAYRLIDTLYFTSSGTFSKGDHAGLRAVRVRTQGGGGGGGGAVATSSNNAVGYGGGGGGYAESLIDADDLSSSETVTVGAGGSSNSGAAGGDGGSSSFGSHASGSGGSGGSLSAASSGAAGALGGNGGSATGDLAIPGVQGGAGITESSLSAPGAGGGAFLASGFALPRWPVRAGNTTNGGLNGSAFGYGAGGSGGINRGTQSAVAGGAGGDGIVIVELFA